MSEKAPRLMTAVDLYGTENLSTALNFAQTQGFNFVSTNLLLKDSEEGIFARGPHEVPSVTYQECLQSRVTANLDVDVEDVSLRRKNEALIKRELEYATFLSVQVVQLDLTKKHANLSLVLQNTLNALEQSHTVPIVWVTVPLCGPPDDEFETFRRWESFRESCSTCPRIWVSLVIPEDLPDNLDAIIDLWKAEQIASVTVSTKHFIMNANNFPVLPKSYQRVMKDFLGLHPIVIVTDVSTAEDSLKPRLYVEYLNHMFAQRSHIGALQEHLTYGFQDSLQIPLQPLADHLESVTYEIFERDPVKYIKYGEAILKAFQDRRQMVEDRKSPLVVMVVGAGRGPLVSACLKCSLEADVPIKLYAVEKNPSAINVLRILNRDTWQNQVTVVSSDMRTFTPADGELADVMVSELLGSWADNELSPECLDGVDRLLKPEGISIPSSYSSYICPIQCPMMHRQAHDLKDVSRPVDHHFQSIYVVYYRHVNHLSDIQRLFTFSHPEKSDRVAGSNTHNERVKELTWTSNASCIFHGFAGYFDCVLYKDVELSTHPATHTPDMNSWFPVYIPIIDPIKVEAGQKISATFWRKTSSTKVWYQWMISEPRPSRLHNIEGKSSSIGLVV